MVAVPSTRTWVAGEVVTDAYMNNTIRDVDNFLLARPIFRGRQTVVQSVASGSDADLTLDTEDVDSAGGHSTVTNTARYTGVYPGWYSRMGGGAFAANATGLRAVNWGTNSVTDNGTGVLFQAHAAASNRIAARGDIVYLNGSSDYITMRVFQSSGAALNTAVAGVEQSNVVICWESN